MNAVGFGAAAVVGFVLSMAGAALVTVVGAWLGAGLALMLVLSLLAAAYLVWLQLSHRSPKGSSLVLLGWVALSGIMLGFGLSLAWALLAYVGLGWLVRCCIRYQRPGTVLLDAAISLVALCAGISVAWYTHSLFLALWSFFLLQALVFLVPASGSSVQQPSRIDDRFTAARCNAEAALQRINTLN